MICASNEHFESFYSLDNGINYISYKINIIYKFFKNEDCGLFIIIVMGKEKIIFKIV